MRFWLARFLNHDQVCLRPGLLVLCDRTFRDDSWVQDWVQLKWEKWLPIWRKRHHYGTLFGGEALRLMDMATFVAASRDARRPVVTASSERIDFHVPVRQGQLAEVVGRVTKTGRTSMTVEVELWAEDLLTGARELCTKGSFVLVAVDENGRPVSIKTKE